MDLAAITQHSRPLSSVGEVTALLLLSFAINALLTSSGASPKSNSYRNRTSRHLGPSGFIDFVTVFQSIHSRTQYTIVVIFD